MDTHVIEEEGHIPIRESSRIDTNFIGNNVYLKKNMQLLCKAFEAWPRGEHLAL